MAMISAPELKRYKLLDMIGCGGMGFVYIGYELKSEQLVAIKLLSPECSEMPVVLERFKLEAQILKSLQHPNIVKFIDAGYDNDFHYLAMEYVKGLSLDAFPRSHSATTLGIKQTLPTVEEYLQLFIKCFDALAYVHKQGLVHRDIKPQNIILTGPEYSPRLIDFGIAKHVREDGDFDQPGEKLYTVVYASPEQLMNKPVDQVSDLFSFGIVMYEKLTGRLPFEGKKEMEVFLSQTRWNFPPPRQLVPEIPQKLEQIVLKLLTRDPAGRYPTAAMVQGELEKLLEVVRQGREGLGLSGIIGDIRESGLGVSGARGFKKRTIAEEQVLVKKSRSEYVEAKNQLRQATIKIRTDPERVEQLKAVCEQLRIDYERLQNQLAMALGFKSQPLVIDRFNAILKLETVAFEKRGIPFTINTIEQKLAHTDGSDIVVGAINFTERAKRVYSFNQKDCYLGWDQSTWFFNAFDEKDFPIFVMVGDPSMPRPPNGFRGFFWPFEFLIAIHKLGRTGVSIIETFTGCDRRGQAVAAQHKETILFSNNLFETLKDRLTSLVTAKPAK
ncbi:MAG TPA: serine/threonine-protein kinase [Candidatus Ozemobacteraceae bacterium]|nr:serine/threonine-protein kinase [Candidatus Ozemobacteraceae bacterium]